MKKTILICAAFILLVPTVLIIGKGSIHATGDQGIGIPIYPGARENPAYPSINTPHMKNIHIFSSDSFEKVVEWYSQKLGKFTIDRQKRGNQALWSKQTKDGDVMTVTISNIDAPAGQIKIILMKGKLKK